MLVRYLVKIVLINNIIIYILIQQLEHLKNDNQRLRDENGALIRVISKLSKWRGLIWVNVLKACHGYQHPQFVFKTFIIIKPSTTLKMNLRYKLHKIAEKSIYGRPILLRTKTNPPIKCANSIRYIENYIFGNFYIKYFLILSFDVLSKCEIQILLNNWFMVDFKVQ